MKRIKPLLFILGLIAVIYLGLGLYYASYSPEVSDDTLWGAWHVHSTFSDGLLSLPEIAEEARRSRVHFVLLTDHGRPHPEASTMDETIDGIRFIGGSESGIPEGHINFFGAKEVPLFNLPPFPPHAFDDIREWGGFGVLTYPEDPRDQWAYWENDLNPDGIEIINITSYFRRASTLGMLGTAIFAPFSEFHFMKDITSPAVALERWDELLNRRKVFGFYACNAHGGFPITQESTWSIPVPSYRAAFFLVGLGIDKKYENEPDIAIRGGDFFSVLRGAGEPKTFDFHAELDGVSHPAGSMLSGSPEIILRVETEELEPRLVLKVDGQMVQSTKDGEIRFTVNSPGVYRAEVYLDDHPFLSQDVPWILSNPIFVGVDFVEFVEEEAPCEQAESIPLDELQVEKDDESSASTISAEDGATLLYSLSKATPEKIDRWVALALRKPMDLSEYAGFYIDAESKDYMRYQVEIRSGDESYYASFKLYPGKENKIYVPFSQFYATFRGREQIPLDAIDSFFITVNTWNSQTGFSSTITIKEMAFCK
jgi:hypothetical protein